MTLATATSRLRVYQFRHDRKFSNFEVPHSAAFGSGASGSLFGASGSANFLSRSTAVAATIFFCATIAVTLGSGAFQKSARADKGGVLGSVSTSAETTAPAAVKKDLQSNQIPR